ncbi:hypothetical protein QE429_000687 [Bacillus sp. SORGH_AS 510]|uniref:outer surface protein n=1 Tax=Bacillus sp. SORGH_AS_0510 TaxID=3041771 RepID=UPI002787171F|nr:outer surface protein [Bacillus sp. SORGH_AS_0510]MDQ1143860.1 hypothetical protein [Bacillus sp. SORGH_AS_0510]
MNRIRLFIYLFLFTLVLGTCLYVSFGKESKIPDFPVPFFANYINDDNPKDLKYSSSGFLYWLTLRVNGWKENDHAGELKVFEKK